MARAGLGEEWSCLFANDIDEKKGTSYKANWGDAHLAVDDVSRITTDQLPGHAELAWASFPCQDLSLAGDGAGLNGERSGTFWPFWRLMQALVKEGRGPALVVLENVCGALSSHGGKDFAAIGAALAGTYKFGALVMDAVRFVPQSRPRLFIVGVRKDLDIPERLTAAVPDARWHPAHLVNAYQKLSQRSKAEWIWWTLPSPPARQSVFSDLVEDEPHGVAWHTQTETKRLLSLMSPRTREDKNGKRAQRAEVRFDDISGCLRTPVGGSSRQTLIIVEDGKIRSRLLSPREAARLMGLPNTYALPKNYNEAYHLAGDGVVVPVVRHLAAHLFEPLLAPGKTKSKEAA